MRVPGAPELHITTWRGWLALLVGIGLGVFVLATLASCDPLQITTPWCDPCPDTIYVDTLPPPAALNW